MGAGAPAPIRSAPASSTDDSSGSILFSPIVMLLIAGVLIARGGDDAQTQEAPTGDGG